MDIKIDSKCLSKRGKECIVVNRFKLSLMRVAKGDHRKTFRCINRKCTVFIVTDREVHRIISIKNDHNHDPLSEQELEKLKRKAVDELTVSSVLDFAERAMSKALQREIYCKKNIADKGRGSSAGVMHQVENDVQIIQPPPPFQYMGTDVLTPARVVLNNIQKLSVSSKEEEKFRRRAYSSISLVLRKRLHCTICDAHIGAYLGLKDMDIEHPLLKVLACDKCTLKYHYLEFPLNPDGRDVRCRWCTESAKEESPLRFCSYCPFAFCEMCIYRNLPLDELASNKNNWICFVCNIKDLWPTRAVLWALRVLIDTNLALKEDKKWSVDQSTCCKNKAVKQRRQVTLPPSVTSQNGHPPGGPPPLRPIAPAPVNNFRPVLKNPVRFPHRVVRPILPITPSRSLPMSAQNSTTQLYDTAWLTEKVHSISTTLLNLNNNLHRIAQGIPEKENKYSIKSKMISMVSLLNISATQLQKASREMEEESKKILDKNYKVAKVTPVSVPITVTEPIKIEPKVVLKPVVIDSLKSPSTSRKRRASSSSRNKRFKGSSEFDSEYEEDEEDFNDPDFSVSTRPDSEAPLTRLRTRACFVKLERLDEKIVDDLKSEDDVGPRPSTSKAPDPLGTVGPDELRAMTGDGEPKENWEDVRIKEESIEPDKEAGSSDGGKAVEDALPAAELSESVAELSKSAADSSLPGKEPSPELPGEGSVQAVPSDDSPELPREGSVQAVPSDDSPELPGGGSIQAVPSGDSAKAASQAADNAHAVTAADDGSQNASEDSSSHNPQPAPDDVPDSSPNTNAQPSLEASHKAVTASCPTADPVKDLPGSQIRPPGDNLNESSATDSSITDTSTTSADNSDS